MIIFPPPFVKTRYNGYFFNTENKILYSIKVGGVLVPLKYREAYKNIQFGVDCPPGFNISINGRKKRYPLTELLKLTIPTEPELIDIRKE